MNELGELAYRQAQRPRHSRLVAQTKMQFLCESARLRLSAADLCPPHTVSGAVGQQARRW